VVTVGFAAIVAGDIFAVAIRCLLLAVGSVAVVPSLFPQLLQLRAARAMILRLDPQFP
jgi:hypothetical protein